MNNPMTPAEAAAWNIARMKMLEFNAGLPVCFRFLISPTFAGTERKNRRVAELRAQLIQGREVFLAQQAECNILKAENRHLRRALTEVRAAIDITGVLP